MATLNVVLVDPGRGCPPGLEQLVQAGQCELRRIGGCKQAMSTAVDGVDAVIVLCDGEGAPWSYDYDALVEHLHAKRIGTLVIDGPGDRIARGESSLVSTAGWGVAADELWGRLTTMAGYRPLLTRIEHELISTERLSKRLNQHLVQMDQELRLAARLQQDFLPRKLPNLGLARFATLYRPATFVSGDIYDVARVDESHLSFYVADAMGHGVAAGLLTMFIKNAVQSKRILEDGYELVRPGETLAELNEMLAVQEMSNGQFATACYCLLNFETLEMQFARAGHPYPLRITSSGIVTELKVEGGLLGLMTGEEYATRTVQLAPGDRVVLFSDGLEGELGESVRTAPSLVENARFAELVQLPAEQMVARMAELLDDREGSLEPSDDVTVVVLEIGEPG